MSDAGGLDLAPIGNCSVSALIDRNGRFVWACAPRFDSDPVFSCLLSGKEANDPAAIGLWAIDLIDQVEVSQAYLRNTAILRTELTDKNGARTQRRVDPYGFIVSNGRVYLVGYDHTRVDMRVFAVDNVLDVVVTPQTYDKPADFNLDAYGANSVSGVVQGNADVEVTVRFSPLIAKAATASAIARDRRVVRRDDGGVDITYRVADPLEIVRWSFGWGAEAEVLGPEDARRAAAEIALQVAARYGPAGT